MGLFGKKEPCPFCGEKVKALFPWRVDGHVVCNSCYGTVDLPQGMVDKMTLAEFAGYRSFRDENQLLKERFNANEKIDFGFWDTKFMFDMDNRLLCMDKSLNTTIFEGWQITAFSIKEDDMPLIEGDANEVRFYKSVVPGRVRALKPQLAQFIMQVRMQRDMERIANNSDDDKSNDRHTNFHLNLPEPFKNFNVEIHFEHPYWQVFRADMSGPTFDNQRPDADDYLNTYKQNVELMGQLARALKGIAFPDAPERLIDPSKPADAAAAAPAVAAPSQTDAAEALRRFKALLDDGIITQEEFDAKKRQLLGL